MTTQTTLKEGTLSIESNNVFSILKKGLDKEPDIVFRELISNATDAIEKRVLLTQETSAPFTTGSIDVILDTDNNKLIIRDNGIGMTEDEVEKYINNIAFSGAEDFIKRNNQAGKDSIIGHFGVGFYSAFMLADHVAIESKSFKDNTAAVRWNCTQDMSYTMEKCNKDTIGTDIILYLNEGSDTNAAFVYDSIRKFFIFSRYDVFFTSPDHDRLLVNDSNPLWRLAKEDINKEDMNAFYQAFFNDANDPVFWLQFASMDLGVRGILYFRNTRNGTEDLEGTIKVYNRGIYVGENIKQIIPQFVNLQSGIIECDNLPLVVSRSSIQTNDSDPNSMLALISECLTQEVSIALHEMFTNERSSYEKYWPELNAFVKYGILKDKTFASVMTKKVIFEDLDGNYKTIDEFIPNKNTPLYYASDRLEQAHYIEIFRKCNTNALLFDHVIDKPLVFKYETLYPTNPFIRIDSNIEAVYGGYVESGDENIANTLAGKVTTILGDRLGNIELKCTRFEDASISTLLVNDEAARRVTDMMEIYGYINPNSQDEAEANAKKTWIINLNNSLVKNIVTTDNNESEELLISQLFDLAMLSQQALRPEDMEAFISRSEKLLAGSNLFM
ncbi:MAG: molecular chaperone HtpG [Suipraeoptans sp.]